MSSKTRMRLKGDNIPQQFEEDYTDDESAVSFRNLEGDRTNICLLLLLYVLQGKYIHHHHYNYHYLSNYLYN